MNAVEAAALLRKMVSIPSVSFHEEAVSDLLCGFFAEQGVSFQRVCNNIICSSSHNSPSKRTLMLCAHLDTVPPSEEYDFDPYCPDYSDYGSDIVLGLGSNDDGASVVSMISAFLHYKDTELPVNLILVLSTEEERSGPQGMRLLYGNYVKAQWAVVGEPTGMRAAISERGLLVLDGVSEGVSAHAATGEGENAIYKALTDIAALKNHRFARTSPLMGDVHLSVTQISAGTAHNIIPDRCSYVVDIRTIDSYTSEEIFHEIAPLCPGSVLKARNLSNHSSATPQDSPLRLTAEALGLGQYHSPTTSDWMRIGCEAIKMGPGDSSRSHKKNEFVTVGEIGEAIEIYTKFISKFCEGGVCDEKNCKNDAKI